MLWFKANWQPDIMGSREIDILSITVGWISDTEAAPGRGNLQRRRRHYERLFQIEAIHSADF
jgi:hypothetical protein